MVRKVNSKLLSDVRNSGNMGGAIIDIFTQSKNDD
jgi:hypothetical protein